MIESPPTTASAFQPRHPAVVAAAIFLLAGLTLFWPIFTGQFLAGPSSDQYVAGYGFRLFGAEHFRAHGRIPLWNPFLFGGLPFVAAMHGDVFYPTAWLRWLLPTDTAMNLGFAGHIVLAGFTMYAFLRTLGVAWGAAVVGGIAWELSGLVAGLVHPGHDGKLFVAALTPLLFLGVRLAVRTGHPAYFGLVALTVGLSLHGHPQLAYYLFVGAALWALWLLLLDSERPPRSRTPRLAAAGLGAVTLGFCLYAIQALPFYEYIPFSPRAPEGGASTGWEYMTAYSLPPAELIALVLPEFHGLKEAYWGTNPLKHHTEYLGVMALTLASVGVADRRRRSTVKALGAIAVLFLLVALGRHTPFYRLWYEVMPLMDRVRAPGSAFFLVTFVLAALAGFGADRLIRGEVALRRVLYPAAGFALLGLLGVAGVLQAVAEASASPEQLRMAMANTSALRLGGLRLAVVSAVVLGVFGAIASRRLTAGSRPASFLLAAATVADLWSLERKMFVFQPPASITYRDDDITAAIRQHPLPYRVLDPGVYHGSWLMAHRIPTLLGYHGNELRWFDDLLGGKNVWRNLGQPVLWDLYAIRFLVYTEELKIAGWRQVLGPVETATGVRAWLYEPEHPPPWVRVIPGAVKVPESQIVSALLDPRFPADRVVLFPDTNSAQPRPLDGRIPEPSPVRAVLREWAPGRMVVTLEGAAPDTTWLLVSENWYPDWKATVDGQAAPTYRANMALLSVPLPAGAREVRLEVRSPTYELGRMISLVAVVVVLGLISTAVIRRETRA
jgi:hypothetical protein